ncbi:hypothetical protein PQR46_20365 [Paraburkholderia sediminicola]
MNSRTIRKALYRKVDEAIDGLIAMFMVGGTILLTAAIPKAALLYLVR